MTLLNRIFAVAERSHRGVKQCTRFENNSLRTYNMFVDISEKCYFTVIWI